MEARSVDVDALACRLGPRLRRNEPLARHTSFRIGGPATVYAEVESEEEIHLFQWAASAWGLPLFVLGGGTNLLVSDRGLDAVVLRLGRAFAWSRWQADHHSTRVEAGAALPFKRLVTESVSHSLEGLEFAEGIPGTLGGGLLMNAGAFGGEIADVLVSVRAIDRTGQAVVYPRSELRFGYRQFDLPKGLVVTALELSLRPGDPEVIRARCLTAKRKREQCQPRGLPNAGSVFKNPPGDFAGRLIERVGLRGFRHGNAMFSEQHANFIVNLGGATAEEVRWLIREAQRRVEERFGIRLEPEIRLVGEWDE